MAYKASYFHSSLCSEACLALLNPYLFHWLPLAEDCQVDQCSSHPSQTEIIAYLQYGLLTPTNQNAASAPSTENLFASLATIAFALIIINWWTHQIRICPDTVCLASQTAGYKSYFDIGQHKPFAKLYIEQLGQPRLYRLTTDENSYAQTFPSKQALTKTASHQSITTLEYACTYTSAVINNLRASHITSIPSQQITLTFNYPVNFRCLINHCLRVAE
ncbi:hypothetical protein DSO57_1003774 [Entomophthora muscae]|uniref:Uncharacterized protein n=1 Tax=Entomophthora muscae TaxID=34485 RepID=A0ACC2TJ71_9FUNG|nr:hypothetical protein DSO57_1003774 [Entomophthora muscae]